MPSITYKSAGGTSPYRFIGPDGPYQGVIKPADPLTLWLRSAEATRYWGHWVLLDEKTEVVDSDLSPTALENRNLGKTKGVIVFVEAPANHFSV